MKTLVTIPDSVVDKIEDFRKKYYPHLSLGKMLVNCTVGEMNRKDEKK